MAEEKTYVFGEGAGNNGILSLLGPMLSQRGVDPNVLLAMQGRNNDGFGEGGWFIWVIFLFFLMGWGGNGFGNNGAGGLGNQLNNDYGREMLLQAINGNGNAISQLATTLNCDINAVQSAINSVQSQIQSVGNQVGMSGQQVINAIQAFQAQTIAPVNAALQDLSARLGAIECKQPATVTIPYIPAMGNLVPVSYSQPVNFSVNPYTTSCGC